MISIVIDDASVEFPVFDAPSRSLKHQMLSFASAGRISKSSGGPVLVSALKNISLEIAEGDRLGVIGSNGSGKSTFLKLVSGVYEPSSGQITRTGKIGSLVDIGLGINPEATGRENILIRGLLLGVDKRTIQLKSKEIIDFAEIGDFIDLPVRTYSTGMAMRLAAGISTVIEPDFLIMDEWLSVGDLSFVAKVRARFENLIDSSKALVIASHDMSLIRELTNSVIWLDGGSIKEYGHPDVVIPKYEENR